MEKQENTKIKKQEAVFHEDATKGKEGSYCPSRVKVKAKALKASKAVHRLLLKDVHNHRKIRSDHHPPSSGPKHGGSEAAQISLEEHPWEKPA